MKLASLEREELLFNGWWRLDVSALFDWLDATTTIFTELCYFEMRESSSSTNAASGGRCHHAQETTMRSASFTYFSTSRFCQLFYLLELLFTIIFPRLPRWCGGVASSRLPFLAIQDIFSSSPILTRIIQWKRFLFWKVFSRFAFVLVFCYLPSSAFIFCHKKRMP